MFQKKKIVGKIKTHIPCQ